MIKKWKLIDSEMVLDEKWYRVRKDTVEVKPGRVVDDYYPGISNDIVLIVALTVDKRLPLVRQYKHGAGEVLIELPAGYMNEGEEPLEAAKRELREETGFTALTWHKLGVFFKNSAKTKGDNVHLFLALDAKKSGEQKLDDNEEIEVTVTSFEKAISMIWNGKINASDSALALLLAKRKMSLLTGGDQGKTEGLT